MLFKIYIFPKKHHNFWEQYYARRFKLDLKGPAKARDLEQGSKTGCKFDRKIPDGRSQRICHSKSPQRTPQRSPCWHWWGRCHQSDAHRNTKSNPSTKQHRPLPGCPGMSVASIQTWVKDGIVLYSNTFLCFKNLKDILESAAHSGSVGWLNFTRQAQCRKYLNPKRWHEAQVCMSHCLVWNHAMRGALQRTLTPKCSVTPRPWSPRTPKDMLSSRKIRTLYLYFSFTWRK